MLTPEELHRLEVGADLKRVVRAAAALNEIYDDKALGEATGKSRNTVASWWDGARPTPDTVELIAKATGLDRRELEDFIYHDGEPPALIEPRSVVAAGIEEGLQRDRQRQGSAAPEGPRPSARRSAPGTRRALS